MVIGTYFRVAPGSKTSWECDWSSFYLAETETIAAHAWTVEPATATLSDQGSAIVFIEDVEAGLVYRLRDQITTSMGVTDAQEVVLRCQ